MEDCWLEANVDIFRSSSNNLFVPDSPMSDKRNEAETKQGKTIAFCITLPDEIE